MSMDEVLSSIRQMLTNEVDTNHIETIDEEDSVEDIFILTPEMRCDDSSDLKKRMQRVLNKMANQEISHKRQTLTNELRPLLKDWLIQMRPDLDNDQVQQEIHKILPNF